MIEEKVRNFGPITASHHLPQFSSAYLGINAGGITTDINEGNKIIIKNTTGNDNNTFTRLQAKTSNLFSQFKNRRLFVQDFKAFEG